MKKRGLKRMRRLEGGQTVGRQEMRTCHPVRGQTKVEASVLAEGEVSLSLSLSASRSASSCSRLTHLLVSAGRSRPLRGLRRSRQERHSKDASKLLLLCDDNILDHDPHRESKDMAFAQSYLSRVRTSRGKTVFFFLHEPLFNQKNVLSFT